MKTPIHYIELYTTDIPAIKEFYSKAFGWRFIDYGQSYVAFEDAGISGGFELVVGPIVNGTLVVLYHEDLEGIRDTLISMGAPIAQDIFSFPGGRRFHFHDPVGNELAIWCKA